MSIVVELVQLAPMNCPDAELTLDGRNQRRPLKQRSRQRFQSSGQLGLATRELVMKPNDADVFLASALLGLDQSGSAI